MKNKTLKAVLLVTCTYSCLLANNSINQGKWYGQISNSLNLEQSESISKVNPKPGELDIKGGYPDIPQIPVDKKA